MKFLIALALTCGCVAASAEPDAANTFRTLVDKEGAISLPSDFRRNWAFLGTWSIAKDDVERSSEASGHGAAGLHNVYTQPNVIDHYRKHREFPDGAVLVKELLSADTQALTTGTASFAQDVEGWFVMVKDRQDRFPDNPLWGDGWGWVLFNADAPSKPVTTNYKTECTGCHIPARRSDWIYVEAYPVLSTD